VLAHQVEDRPRGEAFQREQRLSPGLLAHAVDPAHVVEQLSLVDQVIGRAGFGLAGHGMTVENEDAMRRRRLVRRRCLDGWEMRRAVLTRTAARPMPERSAFWCCFPEGGRSTVKPSHKR